MAQYKRPKITWNKILLIYWLRNLFITCLVPKYATQTFHS